jgi:anti-sigma factor RsiW
MITEFVTPETAFYSALVSRATEVNVAVTSATVPTRLDSAPLSNRKWIRVVNPSPSVRIFVGHSATAGVNAMNLTNCETAEPENGIWEDNIGPSIPVYALSSTGATVTVRVTQRS